MNPQNHSNRYDFVFALLVGLVFTSVGVSLLHLPGILNNLLVLGIAFLMAGLVAVHYMGLKWNGPLIEVIVAIPLALFILLVAVLIPDIAHIPVSIWGPR